jgi:two-component system CheB/CheR fusion protein
MSQENEPAIKNAFPIIGIGASAGGIEALSQLLARLPGAPDMAFLLIQHRDPAHTSLLAEMLSKASGIPLIEAEDGTVVEVNNGYIVPANATLTITDGTLQLHKFDTVEDRRPIDAMFSSLAARVEATTVLGDGCYQVQAPRRSRHLRRSRRPAE